jgi:hypothetical protein
MSAARAPRSIRVGTIRPCLRERSPAILPAGLRPSGHDRLRDGTCEVRVRRANPPRSPREGSSPCAAPRFPRRGQPCSPRRRTSPPVAATSVARPTARYRPRVRERSPARRALSRMGHAGHHPSGHDRLRGFSGEPAVARSAPLPPCGRGQGCGNPSAAPGLRITRFPTLPGPAPRGGPPCASTVRLAPSGSGRARWRLADATRNLSPACPLAVRMDARRGFRARPPAAPPPESFHG